VRSWRDSDCRRYTVMRILSGIRPKGDVILCGGAGGIGGLARSKNDGDAGSPPRAAAAGQLGEGGCDAAERGFNADANDGVCLVRRWRRLLHDDDDSLFLGETHGRKGVYLWWGLEGISHDSFQMAQVVSGMYHILVVFVRGCPDHQRILTGTMRTCSYGTTISTIQINIQQSQSGRSRDTICR
jgi:hypothetical protein